MAEKRYVAIGDARFAVRFEFLADSQEEADQMAEERLTETELMPDDLEWPPTDVTWEDCEEAADHSVEANEMVAEVSDGVGEQEGQDGDQV